MYVIRNLGLTPNSSLQKYKIVALPASRQRNNSASPGRKNRLAGRRLFAAFARTGSRSDSEEKFLPCHDRITVRHNFRGGID